MKLFLKLVLSEASLVVWGLSYSVFSGLSVKQRCDTLTPARLTEKEREIEEGRRGDEKKIEQKLTAEFSVKIRAQMPPHACP